MYDKRALASVSLLLLASCATTPRGRGKLPTVAILPLDVVGQVAQERGARLRRSIQAKIGTRTGAKLIDATAVDRVLVAVRGCRGHDRRDDPCAVSAGSKLGATHVVSGAVGGLGKTYLIQLKLVDVQRAAVIRALEEAHFGGPATLDHTIDKAVGRLFLVPPRPSPWYRQWWFWTMVGTAAASAVILPLSLHQSDPYEEVRLP